MTTTSNTHESNLNGARILARDTDLDFASLTPYCRSALVSAFALQNESGWDADTLRTCWTLRIPFTAMTDSEFAELLANLGLLNTQDMVRVARHFAYYLSEASRH